MTGKEAVQKLLDMPDEVVPASARAPILRTHPSVIRDMVKSGEWDRCAYVRIKNRIKFYRVDFLRKGGWIS